MILLGIALWVRDIPYQPDVFTTTLQQLIKISPMGDPASFATAAIDIAKHGWVSSANEWILGTWPPGFIMLEALIVKVFGLEAPVILVLQVLAVSLFSVVLVLLYAFLNEHVKSRFAFVLPLLIFIFPVSRVFLLQPTGITLGESFSIGFFLLFILLAFSSVERSSLRYAVYAGLCLALSAYFRSQFEIILLALTGWGILLVIAIRLTRLQKFMEPKFVKPTVKTIVTVLLVAHAATMPWRIYHWIYQGVPAWVATPKGVIRNSVMSSAFLENSNGGFIVAGAGNLVCKIDPANCGDTENAMKLFVKTFITHPVEWYSLKFDVSGKYWFSSVENWVSISVKPTFIDIVMNGLLLIALIALVIAMLARKVRSHGLWVLLVWFNAALFSAYILIFSLAHFEARYFYFPKIAGIVMLIIVACLYYRPINKSCLLRDTSI